MKLTAVEFVNPVPAVVEAITLFADGKAGTVRACDLAGCTFWN